ncbi:sulfur oxidation c-type cytochrome SoxX [Acidihalobacter prosperus]
MRYSAKRISMIASMAALLGGLYIQPCMANTNPQPSAADIAQGKALVFSRSKGNCLACHKIKGGDSPGNIGPPLNNMKARFPNRSKLYAQIWDAHRNHPNTLMPPFGLDHILTKSQINKIIDFLYTL